jgi:hypothetical protein
MTKILVPEANILGSLEGNDPFEVLGAMWVLFEYYF